MINIGDYKQTPSSFKKKFTSALATPLRGKFDFLKS
jgi:hypothetical protein